MSDKQEFETAQESDAFNSKLHAMLNDPRLKDWAHASEDNCGAENSVGHILKARSAFNNYLNSLEA